jgi:acyl-CoA reductase-like NAD-dependent aldehyde dehydrogenase
MTHRCDVHSASSLQENDDFYARAPSATSEGLKLAGLLASLAPTLLDALTEVATHASAEDELARAIAALARSGWEIARNSPPVLGKLAVFMPSNNILYSYVLYGLIPSLYSDQVIVRPSSRVHHTTVRVHRILSEACGAIDGPTIVLSNAGQRAFSRECRDADLVVFTGRYENSFAISAGLGRNTRLLRFGSGPNPIVIGKGVDLALVVGDVVTARLYNAGQDCLCPDVIFVHSHVHDAFIDGLLERLDGITVGDRRDPDTIVAPLVYADAVERAGSFVIENAERVRFGGSIDIDEGTVEPTVVELPFHAAFHPPELFSPVFCIVQYENDAQIEEWLRSPAELERGMYVSTYGETSLAGATIGTSVVCREHTAFDAEDGNTPFGGFGKRASSVVCDHAFTARPLLISKEARARHHAISSA